MVETKVDSNTKIANELIVALHRMLREVEKRPAEPDDHVQSSSESGSSEDSQSSSKQTLSEDDILMAILEVKTEGFDPMDTEASPSTSAPPLFQINSGKHIFTLDDIPSTRWPQRFQEFHAWMDT
ncbi:hypothetical protein V6N12_006950 [Hibiscus sabdariffa]|uniref:Uncharacterized protein n=1 Tax=Hibiscus sabdariffa TaxID=183260 RepID=A0ABR2F0B1_9ROSI